MNHRTPTYRSWENMKQRCLNPRCPKHPRYGGRGIAIDPRWLGPRGFQHFLADMGERPPGTTLDRVKNDRGYSKRNCRWATPAQQAQNRRDTRLSPARVRSIRRMHHRGMRVTDIARATGLYRSNVSRIVRNRAWREA